MVNSDQTLSRRHRYFLVFFSLCCFPFLLPLKHVVLFALTRDYGTHILIVIPISVFIIYLKRSEVFSEARFDVLPGLLLLLVALSLAGAAYIQSGSDTDRLSMEILSLVLLWVSGFVFSYGRRALRAAAFPVGLLLLLVPIPDIAIEKLIVFLQTGSALVAFWLFRILHVPVLKEGLVLHLPALDLEVATECSGIRSSMVLLITTLLVGEFVLSTLWRKSLLVLFVIPVVILKNGMRIVTIALLTVYVNRQFLHGWLHQSGGIVFYLLGLLALWPILNLLRNAKTHGVRTPLSRSISSNAMPDQIQK